MALDDTLSRIEAELGHGLLDVDRKSDRRAWVTIAPETVKQASRVMFEGLGARFQIATGVDSRAGIEVMYHWALDADDHLVTLRVVLDHAGPAVDSIATMCPAAEWIEREMWELLGIGFRGHPDLRHLLLADDWPEGNYPLRRNYSAPGKGEAGP